MALSPSILAALGHPALAVLWFAALLTPLGCGQTTRDPGDLPVRVAGSGSGASAGTTAVGGMHQGGVPGAGGAATDCVVLANGDSEIFDEAPEGGPDLRHLTPQVLVNEPERHLYAVRGYSSSDVFAAGNGIWHWDGCRWTEMRSEGLFREVFGPSDQVLWFVGGANGPCPEGCPGLIARYDRMSWEEVARPDQAGPLSSIWVSPTGVLWVGGVLQGNSDAGSQAVVWRLDGSGWTEVVRSPVASQPFRVIGYSDSEVYIGRRDDVARWNGAELVSISVDGRYADACSSSTGASPTDIWLGRCRIVSSRVTLVNFQARWGTSEADMWTVGYRNAQGVGYVARSNGLGVVELSNEVEADLMGVWGASPTDVWVVGTQGALVHYGP